MYRFSSRAGQAKDSVYSRSRCAGTQLVGRDPIGIPIYQAVPVIVVRSLSLACIGTSTRS
jgi:hypothetical protein